MSNSKYVVHTNISPNSSPRTAPISKITIHHMAGNCSIETCGNIFAEPSRQASSNYGIGSDGRVGLYVDESRRAWTSSNRDNDNVAVTIEVANDGGEPDWHVSDKALAALIDLCVDICQRNGIEKLNYTGDKSGNLTMHKWFAATGCPGPYLGSKFPYIAAEVNKRLKVKETYRVRKAWKNTASQIGAFSILDYAINQAKKNPGYSVFNNAGEVVYPIKASAAKVTVELNELRKGDTGAQVKTMQRLLLALGYNLGGYGADSSFGNATRTAVIAFQTAKGLKADGIVGKDTWSALLGV